MNRDRMKRHAGTVLVALAAVLVYANSLWNGFALDDVFIIQVNTRVHQLADQSRIWLTPYWPGYGTELGLYRPMAIFFYALQWAVSGGAAWFFHAVSVLLHACASVLAFLLLQALLKARVAALLGGLVFAVHPVRTEAVANLVGQAELIAGAATLGACLIYATRPVGVATSWGRRCAIVLLFAAAVLTKESAIVLPALLVALDVAQRRVILCHGSIRNYLRGVAMPMFLLFATAAAYLVLRVDVLGSIGGVDAAPSLPFLREEARVPTAFRAWPEYVRLMFFPADLAADYSPGVILPVEGMSPMALLGAVLLLFAIVLAALTPVLPAAGLPAAWFLISALPVSNLLLPIGVVVAERLLYTPAFAVSLIVGYGWKSLRHPLTRARTRRIAHAAAAAILALLSARTVLRNPDWKDTPAVWQALIEDHPESYRSPWVLSSITYARGQTEVALKYLELALQIWPKDSQVLADLAYHEIGRGKFTRAIELLEESRRLVPWVTRTEILLAQASIGARQFERALQAAIRADRLGGDRVQIFSTYAQAYDGLGRLPDAIGAWRATLSQPSGDVWTFWSRYARSLARSGLHDHALAAADSTRFRIADEDSTSLTVADALRDAIARGCYAPSAPDGCADPLDGWLVLVPFETVRIARDSQNATGTGSPGAPARMPGD